MIAFLLLLLRLTLTAALYGFLGWALYTLWRDFQSRQSMLSYQAPALQLSIETDQGPQRLRFSQPFVLIGRNRSCDFAIDDRTLSSQHARLSYHHSQWWLEDLGSTNGTLLHGEPVTTPVVLSNGDPITCGKVIIQVEIERG